jgi:Fe-S-cluster containining protein
MIDKRLRQLFDELIADKGYVTGRRSFPRTLTEDDAVAIVGALHEEIDNAARHRAAAARRIGTPLACGPGCTGCCEELVMVWKPEALRVARWLNLPENAATKQWFLDGYPGWKARVGDAPEQLNERFRRDDDAGHLALYIAHWKRRILCAFNRDGMCTIYDVRPLVCRNAHAVGTAARCYGDCADEAPPTRVGSDQFDAWLEQSRGRIRAAHHAIGGPRQEPAALCDAVYAALVDPGPP